MGINQDQLLLDELGKKESQSKFEYDKDVSDFNIPDWIPPAGENRGKIENIQQPNMQPEHQGLGRSSRIPLGMESEWKNIPPDILPSKGFGYPIGFEIAIKAADVREIRQYSTVDDSDRIDLDEKLNAILNKCMKIRWESGILESYDLWYEDRFFVIMSIRDMTFTKGENRILLPVTKNCTKPECEVADKIELKSNLLDSFELDNEILKRYSNLSYSFKFIPKDGGPEMNLYIPTVGVTTVCRKIIKNKKLKEKKYDESFANIATFIIPDWRGLDERTYDQYEIASNEWTALQFSIADQISQRINFATKSRIYSKCTSCGGEVTADITFPRGYRSLFIISDIFSQLL